VKELLKYFVSTFFLVEFGRFEERSLVFVEVIAMGNRAPVIENVVSNCAVFRVKVPESGETLEFFAH
jgi:hypothetical protein